MDALNLLAIFLPPFIDLINQHIASKNKKFWIAIIISVCVGILINYPKLNHLTFWTGVGVFTNVILVVGTAQAVYLKYWQDSQARKTLIAHT